MKSRRDLARRVLVALNFSGCYTAFCKYKSEEKKRGQQGRTVHDSVLIESAVNQFCGNVVTHVGCTKWERRKVRKIIELKQEEINDEGGRVRFDPRPAWSGHVPS